MRTRPRPRPTRPQTLIPVTSHCPACQHKLWTHYRNFRTVTTLDAVLRLTLYIRRCPNADCPRFLRPFRPHGKRTSSAWKTEKLCQVANVPSRPLAFDFQRPFAWITTQ